MRACFQTRSAGHGWPKNARKMSQKIMSAGGSGHFSLDGGNRALVIGPK